MKKHSDRKPLWFTTKDYPVLLEALKYSIDELGLTEEKDICLTKLEYFVKIENTRAFLEIIR